ECPDQESDISPSPNASYGEALNAALGFASEAAGNANNPLPFLNQGGIVAAAAAALSHRNSTDFHD
ncbi:Hypothetical protein FKW44_016228, partial [Caligus rogercresseyi]